ncbi:MAG: hypothetical protein ACR2MG_09660, partial [Pyrinomonadaceae bacterium]
LSVAFFGEMTSSNSPSSAQAQTEIQTTRRGNVTVRRKRTGGVVGGAKYVGRKTYRGAKYVGRKTYQGGKYVGTKTYQGGKYVGTKTVKGTKYAGKKTVGGAKAVTSRTKKILLGN